MIKKVINIDSPAYLNTQYEQLKIRLRETDKIKSVPLEEIGVLILNNYSITISAVCMMKLNEYKIAMIVSDKSHLPTGMMLPFDGNFEQTERIRKQINLSKPREKNAWKQIIISKIENQSLHLEFLNKDFKAIRKKKDKVLSGDTTNQEGQASKLYWGKLFSGKDFYRDRYGPYPNNMLNYCYAILRATVARSIVASGLHPSIGLFHHNKYNSYCLADDMMEPFRPFADSLVYKLFLENPDEEFELSQEIRSKLLSVLYLDTEIDKTNHTLEVAVSRSCYSLYKYINGETDKLELPNLCESVLTD